MHVSDARLPELHTSIRPIDNKKLKTHERIQKITKNTKNKE